MGTLREGRTEEATGERDELTEEAAAEADGELLPAREAISLIMPGATADTAGAESIPVEAQQWHGTPTTRTSCSPQGALRGEISERGWALTAEGCAPTRIALALALIPPFFAEGVVALGVPERSGVRWVASGLLYRPAEATDELFVVTNRHVVEDQGRVIVRFDATVGEGGRHVEAPHGKGWAPHPSSDIDLAVFPLSSDSGARECMAFVAGTHSMGVSEMRAEGVTEGDPVFVLGFPMGMVALSEMASSSAPAASRGAKQTVFAFNVADGTKLVRRARR